ncbi:MAG: hypothetical protein QM760_16665 [Nibricoccus sp.]
MPHHSSVSWRTGVIGHAGLACPGSPLKYAPPTPASFIASESAVIPSRETDACIQYQITHGFAADF